VIEQKEIELGEKLMIEALRGYVLDHGP
jgi:hypothetical protein